MAIDFMVMPFSRYVSGDYITPAMRAAWMAGVPYTIFSPDGRSEYPPDMPFGGADAPARRQEYLPMVLEDLAALPPTIATQAWDEASAAEPCFERVDPTAYDALLHQAKSRPPPQSWLSRLRNKPPRPSHLGAGAYLPCAFDEPFDMLAPVTATAASVDAALDELDAISWSESAQPAAATLRDALHAAKRLRLPMIVDW